ncbi:hypothetical protein L7F22_048146 [Adiantum nelumboides]|nr:hypothetical protein [Adiantum nelumboides]
MNVISCEDKGEEKIMEAEAMPGKQATVAKEPRQMTTNDGANKKEKKRKKKANMTRRKIGIINFPVKSKPHDLIEEDWMNSLEHEEFFDCPTPLMGGGFGSGLLVRIDDPHGNDIAVLPVPGSPLHEHLGYKSARDLLDKSTLSSDDGIMAYSDTNSSLSNSSASVNTFKPPGFDNGGPSLCTSLQKAGKSHTQNCICLEQGNSTSITSLFKRTLQNFGENKSLSVCNSKSRVVVNRHALPESAIKTTEERAGKLRPGTYWYDRIAGFWGITGGPCLGVLPPFIEELDCPMARNCSNGDTQVFVNGRELHHKDLALLSHRGLSMKPGETYVIDFNGVVIEEASSQELIHLGKLAPT